MQYNTIQLSAVQFSAFAQANKIETTISIIKMAI